MTHHKMNKLLGKIGGKRQYMLFQGHSGPVYAATFSPFGDFILSSSADKTIRLWSTKLNANLVCFKGHNYPVWDVQFSPAGHYFASCSHDRTARIWSMDRIQPVRIMAGHLSDVDLLVGRIERETSRYIGGDLSARFSNIRFLLLAALSANILVAFKLGAEIVVLPLNTY